MARFGAKAKQPAKPKKDSKSPNLGADIDAINAATLVAEEEESDETSAVPATVPPLAHTRNEAYGTFASEFHSEAAAKERRLIEESPDREYSRDFDLAKIYVDGDGREFRYDEYGATKYLDEVPEEIAVPERFEDGVGSATREREAAEAARRAEEDARAAALQKQRDEDEDDDYDRPRRRRKRSSEEQEHDGGARRRRKGNSSSSDEHDVFAVAEEDEEYDDFDDEASDQPHNASRGRRARAADGSNDVPNERFRQPKDTPTIDLRAPVDHEVAYRELAEEVTRRRTLGADASEFPTIDSTIASLVESSRSPEEITNALLGYLKNVLAAEGVEATMNLLGEKNIYTPLLVSALKYNNEQHPIDPVALQELWKIEPEIVVEEKVVYVPQEGVPGDRVVLVNVPMSPDEIAGLPAPISDRIQARLETMLAESRAPQPDAPKKEEVAESGINPVQYDY